jgi:hypothetical protein
MKGRHGPGAVVLAGLHPDPPAGANIGDFLASPHTDGGLGLGTLWTSVIFLGTILATVVYLTATRVDRTEVRRGEAPEPERSLEGA